LERTDTESIRSRPEPPSHSDPSSAAHSSAPSVRHHLDAAVHKEVDSLADPRQEEHSQPRYELYQPEVDKMEQECTFADTEQEDVLHSADRNTLPVLEICSDSSDEVHEGRKKLARSEEGERMLLHSNPTRRSLMAAVLEVGRTSPPQILLHPDSNSADSSEDPLFGH